MRQPYAMKSGLADADQGDPAAPRRLEPFVSERAGELDVEALRKEAIEAKLPLDLLEHVLSRSPTDDAARAAFAAYEAGEFRSASGDSVFVKAPDAAA